MISLTASISRRDEVFGRDNQASYGNRLRTKRRDTSPINPICVPAITVSITPGMVHISVSSACHGERWSDSCCEAAITRVACSATRVNRTAPLRRCQPSSPSRPTHRSSTVAGRSGGVDRSAGSWRAVVPRAGRGKERAPSHPACCPGCHPRLATTASRPLLHRRHRARP